MKKIFSFIVLSAFLVSLATPVLVGAQDQTLKECCVISQDVDLGDAGTCSAKNAVGPPDATFEGCDTEGGECETESWGMVCLVGTVYNVTNWLFYLMMIAVVIVFVIAAAWFMLAGGDVEKTGKAKGLMILGIVGLVIALVAKLIPSVVKLIVGM